MTAGSGNVLRVDGARLWDTVMQSARIGPGKAGGLRRLALSDADREVRDLFAGWCRAAGLIVTVDGLGNMFARLPGREDHLPPVMAGSHLDTQIAGGRFDGIVGVLGALEAVRTLVDRGIRPKRPIEIVNWSNEEGARFSPPMSCSAVFAGLQTLEWGLSRRDSDGKLFGEELKRIGYDGEAPVGGRPVDAYFELHIEQGPILDAERVPVGVVTGSYAVHGLKIDIRGETAHTGPTPMDRRRNALVGAARMIVGLDDIGWDYHPSLGKTTSSRLEAWPNTPGILSEYAQLTCDMRHPDPATLAEMMARFRRVMEEAATKAQVETEIVDEWVYGSEAFDPDCVALVRDAAERLGVPHRDILSQAGHDAFNMARFCPTAMIFCPCKDGITHNEAEDCTLDDTVPSVDVLLHALLARADR